MGDLISRAEAIQMYCKAGCGCEPSECGLTYEQDGAEECGVVRFLRSVPPAGKHGKWIDKPGPYYRMQAWCSCCGQHSGIGGIESNRHKPYCPNCGAKMDLED